MRYVVMKLGLSLCGTLVDAKGLHVMVCKKALGKIASTMFALAVTSFGEPAVLLGSQLSKSPLD